MALGDPANGGANHGTANSSAVTSFTQGSLGFAATGGNTLLIALRRGGSAVSQTTTIAVSENSGSTFPNSATLFGSAHSVANAGWLLLFYYQIQSNCANGVLQFQITVGGTAESLVLGWGEYVGALTANGTEQFTDNGTGTSYNSGNLTTSVTSTLIGVMIDANVGNDTLTPGSSNSLTWVARATGASTSFTGVMDLADFGAGGQASGTWSYNGTQSLSQGEGAAIYSFVGVSSPVARTYPMFLPRQVGPPQIDSLQLWAEIHQSGPFFPAAPATPAWAPSYISPRTTFY